MTDVGDYNALIDSPVGTLGIRMDKSSISGIDFLVDQDTSKLDINLQDADIKPVRTVLDAYFSSADVELDITISLQGTAFQRSVWAILRSIPSGQTRTYGEIARQLNSSPRAVGNACRRNPIPILVPCHRVISASGAGGFMGARSGAPMEIKHWLLEHERVS